MGYWFCCGEVMIKTHHFFSFSTIENCQRFLPNCSLLKGLIVLLFLQLLAPGNLDPLRLQNPLFLAPVWFKRTRLRVKVQPHPSSVFSPPQPDISDDKSWQWGKLCTSHMGKHSGIKPERSVLGLCTHIHTTFMINKKQKFRLRLYYEVCSDAESRERAKRAAWISERERWRALDKTNEG